MWRSTDAELGRPDIVRVEARKEDFHHKRLEFIISSETFGLKHCTVATAVDSWNASIFSKERGVLFCLSSSRPSSWSSPQDFTRKCGIVWATSEVVLFYYHSHIISHGSSSLSLPSGFFSIAFISPFLSWGFWVEICCFGSVFSGQSRVGIARLRWAWSYGEYLPQALWFYLRQQGDAGTPISVIIVQLYVIVTVCDKLASLFVVSPNRFALFLPR